jgi:hypothetical protein
VRVEECIRWFVNNIIIKGAPSQVDKGPGVFYMKRRLLLTAGGSQLSVYVGESMGKQECEGKECGKIKLSGRRPIEDKAGFKR